MGPLFFLCLTPRYDSPASRSGALSASVGSRGHPRGQGQVLSRGLPARHVTLSLGPGVGVGHLSVWTISARSSPLSSPSLLPTSCTAMTLLLPPVRDAVETLYSASPALRGRRGEGGVWEYSRWPGPPPADPSLSGRDSARVAGSGRGRRGDAG